MVMMLPFAWMVLASFRSLPDIDANRLLSSEWHPENYKQVFVDPVLAKRVSFARYYFNSLFVALWVTFLTCVTSAMAAFAFARLRWRGRDTLFSIVLATMMLPGVVTMIPQFVLFAKLPNPFYLLIASGNAPDGLVNALQMLGLASRNWIRSLT